MPANPRHDQIITLIRKLRKVSVHDLTERMGVSRVTIRKDLSFLEEKGILIRTHGGAMLAENQQKDKQFSIRGETVIQEKTGIACKARDMVLEGDTIFLDAGSTTAVLARELRGKNIRVITNSLDIMNILAGEPDITLISLGGNFRMEAGSFIGPLAENTVRQFRIDIAFLGASAFSSDGTFASHNIIESQLKSTVLKNSRRKVILSDSSKFGKDAFSIFAGPKDIDILITDLVFKGKEGFLSLGIEVITA